MKYDDTDVENNIGTENNHRIIEVEDQNDATFDDNQDRNIINKSQPNTNDKISYLISLQ